MYAFLLPATPSGHCRWLHTLVQLAPKQLLPHTAALLREVLPCLGHAGEFGSRGWQQQPQH